MTTREAEWTPYEVALLLASRSIEADRGPHGHLLSESTSSDADPARWDAKYRYVASAAPVVDYAAKALGDAQDAYRKLLGKDVPMPHGLHFRVHREERG